MVDIVWRWLVRVNDDSLIMVNESMIRSTMLHVLVARFSWWPTVDHDNFSELCREKGLRL